MASGRLSLPSNEGSAAQLQAYASKAGRVGWRLLRSTGTAGWITITTCLVLLVPLVIQIDREQQLLDFESQQLGALTGGSGGGGAKPAAGKRFLALYRRVLRCHGRMPPPLRAMGDSYARSEFRQHRDGRTTPAQWRAFEREWARYAAALEGRGDDPLGDPAGDLAAASPPVAAVGSAGRGGGADGPTSGALGQGEEGAFGFDPERDLLPEQRRRLGELEREARQARERLLRREED